MDAQKVKIA